MYTKADKNVVAYHIKQFQELNRPFIRIIKQMDIIILMEQDCNAKGTTT